MTCFRIVEEQGDEIKGSHYGEAAKFLTFRPEGTSLFLLELA